MSIETMHLPIKVDYNSRSQASFMDGTVTETHTTATTHDSAHKADETQQAYAVHETPQATAPHKTRENDDGGVIMDIKSDISQAPAPVQRNEEMLQRQDDFTLSPNRVKRVDITV